MIWELELTKYMTQRGPLWYGKTTSYRTDGLVASNVIDWLWQRINEVKGELAVGKDGSVLFITDEVCTGIGAEVPTLFTGTAREVVQQLRPYLLMMEGML